MPRASRPRPVGTSTSSVLPSPRFGVTSASQDYLSSQVFASLNALRVLQQRLTTIHLADHRGRGGQGICTRWSGDATATIRRVATTRSTRRTSLARSEGSGQGVEAPRPAWGGPIQEFVRITTQEGRCRFFCRPNPSSHPLRRPKDLFDRLRGLISVSGGRSPPRSRCHFYSLIIPPQLSLIGHRRHQPPLAPHHASTVASPGTLGSLVAPDPSRWARWNNPRRPSWP